MSFSAPPLTEDNLRPRCLCAMIGPCNVSGGSHQPGTPLPTCGMPVSGTGRFSCRSVLPPLEHRVRPGPETGIPQVGNGGPEDGVVDAPHRECSRAGGSSAGDKARLPLSRARPCSPLRVPGRPKRRLPKNFFTIFYKKPIRALHSYAIFPSTGILH